MDFDYKKYSLENLEKWVSDALTSAEATPKEIYDVIKGVVDEEYHYFKHHTARCYELLALLNGNGIGHLSCDKDDKSPECQSAWNDFWEENYYPEESSQYTEEELNAMCDGAASDNSKKILKVVGEDKPYPIHVSEDGDVWIPDSVIKEDKVVKWQLPVEVDGISGEYYIQFPDDLMEAAGIKEDDMVEWIDRKDGSFELRKVNGTK
jgi:hypothetical protein